MSRLLAPRIPLEAEIQRAVLLYLKYDKRVAWAERINSGAHVVGAGKARRYVRFNTIEGCSDIIGQIVSGEFLAIECKRPGCYPTEEQRGFLEKVRSFGGCAGVARSIDDVDKILRGFYGG